MTPSSLLTKYDVPTPRYTSYPTVPYWTDNPTTAEWLGHLREALLKKDRPWSMYIHLPFCETLCTFCGCNTVITKDHTREEGYIKSVLAEWDLYRKAAPDLEQVAIQNLHLGGGTPTFLSPGNLRLLLEPILASVNPLKNNFEGSLEVDPRRTTLEHLKVLRLLGFQRVSMGVQDFNPEVQRLINRKQSFQETKDLTVGARSLGFDSVNYDLIYGLPKQTMDGFRDTIAKTIEVKPDRLALYSFALVPWIKPAQRLFKDDDLPVGPEKRALYEMARRELLSAGYLEIGMDHFALPTDSLALAMKSGTLHRNFMGYTSFRTDVLLGLGVSAISETPTCFHQNEKVLPVYERSLKESTIPTFRGHKLSDIDQKRREQILNLMTQYRVDFEDREQYESVKSFLMPLLNDYLISYDGEKRLILTEAGKPFLRNVCVAFDQRLREKAPDTRIFSQAI